MRFRNWEWCWEPINLQLILPLQDLIAKIWILFPIPDSFSQLRWLITVQGFRLLKWLTFFLDENLNFEYNLKQTKNKISKALFPISKAKHLLSSSVLKSLYYALVHPLFLYCLPTFSSASLKSLNSLFLLQKKCINKNYLKI